MPPTRHFLGLDESKDAREHLSATDCEVEQNDSRALRTRSRSDFSSSCSLGCDVEYLDFDRDVHDLVSIDYLDSDDQLVVLAELHDLHTVVGLG